MVFRESCCGVTSQVYNPFPNGGAPDKPWCSRHPLEDLRYKATVTRSALRLLKNCNLPELLPDDGENEGLCGRGMRSFRRHLLLRRTASGARRWRRTLQVPAACPEYGVLPRVLLTGDEDSRSLVFLGASEVPAAMPIQGEPR